MKYTQYIILPLLILFMGGCAKDNVIEPTSSFSLSHDNIKLAIGNSGIINVKGTSVFTFSIDDNIASATKLRNNSINIIGNSSGNTRLLVQNMDDDKFQECKVEVCHSENEDENDKISSILNNDIIRVESDMFGFNIDDIGMLHSIEKIESRIIATFASIDNNKYFKIHLLNNNGELDDALIYTDILNENINNVSFSLLKRQDKKVWIRLIINDLLPIFAVLEI